MHLPWDLLLLSTLVKSTLSAAVLLCRHATANADDASGAAGSAEQHGGPAAAAAAAIAARRGPSGPPRHAGRHAPQPGHEAAHGQLPGSAKRHAPSAPAAARNDRPDEPSGHGPASGNAQPPSRYGMIAIAPWDLAAGFGEQGCHLDCTIMLSGSMELRHGRVCRCPQLGCRTCPDFSLPRLLRVPGHRAPPPECAPCCAYTPLLESLWLGLCIYSWLYWNLRMHLTCRLHRGDGLWDALLSI